MENNNTVTVSLEKYEQMKEEMETLKEQVKQKEVIKYVKTASEEAVIVIIFLIFLNLFQFYKTLMS